MKLSLFIAGLSAAILAPVMHAGVIFENGPPNQVNGNEMSQWIQAENFQVATDTSILSVQFWAALQSPGSYNGSITYTIYADASGSPGTQLATGSATPTPVATGLTAFGDAENVLNFDLNSPFLATGGTVYWLGLHNGPLSDTTRDEFYWETTGAGNAPTGQEFNLQGGSSFSPNGSEHAFELFDTAGGGSAVPEPGAVALVGAGLAGLLFNRFRRR